MIKKILLKFGRAQGLEHANIETTPVTVFVGPNNSGKSQVLAEINRFCREGQKAVNDVILDELVFEAYDQDTAEQTITYVTLGPKPTETVRPGKIIVGKRNSRLQVNKQALLEALKNPNKCPDRFCSWYLAYNTIILNGNNRINLVNQQAAGDLQEQPNTCFQVL